MVKRGHIVEQGTHDELMQRNGAYFTLVQMQQAGCCFRSLPQLRCAMLPGLSIAAPRRRACARTMSFHSQPTHTALALIVLLQATGDVSDDDGEQLGPAGSGGAHLEAVPESEAGEEPAAPHSWLGRLSPGRPSLDHPSSAGSEQQQQQPGSPRGVLAALKKRGGQMGMRRAGGGLMLQDAHCLDQQHFLNRLRAALTTNLTGAALPEAIAEGLPGPDLASSGAARAMVGPVPLQASGEAGAAPTLRNPCPCTPLLCMALASRAAAAHMHPSNPAPTCRSAA